MTLTKGAVSMFLYEVNHLVDEGKFESLQVVKQHMENKDVVEWLSNTYENDIDLSLFVGKEWAPLMNEKMYEFNSVHDGNEHRKWGISKNGLCLLVAWSAEMLLNI